jgi:hypothetical protein
VLVAVLFGLLLVLLTAGVIAGVVNHVSFN